MIYTMVIPNWKPASVNDLLSMHWAKAARLKLHDAQTVGIHKVYAGIPDAKGKRRVTWTVTVTRGRSPDPSNLLKSFEDALVQSHVLVDDATKWAEVLPPVIQRGTSVQTVVVVEDITEDGK